MRRRGGGRRYCFIGAIIEADPNLPGDSHDGMFGPHFIKESLDIFEGGTRKCRDSHGMFDTPYFIKWMATLLDALDFYEIKNTFISMDSASYHTTLPPDTPKKLNKKATLQDACTRYGIAFDPSKTKPELWEKLEAHIKAHVPPTIVGMARERGHEVI